MPVKTIATDCGSYTYPLLIKNLLHSPLASAPNQEIVYRDKVRLTYLEMRSRLSKLACALERLGVEQGHTVAVMDWDSHRYLECYFAVPMMGAVLQTVNVRLSPDQIRYTLDHADARVVIVNREFVDLLQSLLPSLPKIRSIIVIDDDQPAPDAPIFDGEYESLLKQEARDYIFPDFDENAVATTFYTTGTTGVPKGVCFTHRQLVIHTITNLAAVASSAKGQDFRRGDVYMPITPMFHVHAWGIPYIATLLGVKQVYPGRYEPGALLALREREKVTFSHCVPTILQMLLDMAVERKTSLAGWKITVGGAALPSGLLRQALDLGMDVFAGYGMSETGPILTLTQLDEGIATEDEFSTRQLTGRPVPLVELRIVDEEMRDVPHDGQSQGEIVVRAPWLTSMYVGDPNASRELWRGGYLHTQDIAVIDSRGFVRITDRLKDVIKTGGEWVSSLAIEDLISRHPDVAEVAVVGVPDKRWGERPVALVVARRGTADVHALPASVRQCVLEGVARGLISKFAVPEIVKVVASLDRTSVGKVNKKKMRHWLVGSP